MGALLYFIVREGGGIGGGWCTPQLDADLARSYAKSVGGLLCGVELALFEDYTSQGAATVDPPMIPSGR